MGVGVAVIDVLFYVMNAFSCASICNQCLVYKIRSADLFVRAFCTVLYAIVDVCFISSCETTV